MRKTTRETIQYFIGHSYGYIAELAGVLIVALGPPEDRLKYTIAGSVLFIAGRAADFAIHRLREREFRRTLEAKLNEILDSNKIRLD